jgi:hypothetical protein
VRAWLRKVRVWLLQDPLVDELRSQLENERWSFQRLMQHHDTYVLQLRQDFRERLKERQAVIDDLRLRLAVTESDALREKLAKAAAAKPKPVPEFEGPVSFQDELGRIKLVADEAVEEENTSDAV